MAEDVCSLQPASPVICGDAHLGNFGFYASPERNLVIDLNDFDEAHPGAWEWDLRRLVASIWVAGRQNGSTEAQCGESVSSCVAACRQEVQFMANEPLLLRSYERLDVERLHGEFRTSHCARRSHVLPGTPDRERATRHCLGSRRNGTGAGKSWTSRRSSHIRPRQTRTA